MLKNVLTLAFAQNWRTYAALASFALCCGLEWAGIDVPEFTAPKPLEALMMLLTALGIYERVKLLTDTKK